MGADAPWVGSLLAVFFEKDDGMCTVEGSVVKITLFECYCCGALVPANLRLDLNNASGAGGAPPTQEMER